MELLETQDPYKRELIAASNRHRLELKKEVRALSNKTEQSVKNALIIGGALTLTYLLVSQLGTGATKKKKSRAAKQNEEGDELTLEESASISPIQSVISEVGSRLISQASILLLDLAKEKLTAYLTHRQTENENS